MKYIVSYKYTLPETNQIIFVEDLEVGQEFLKDVIFHPDDIYKHVLINAKLIEE